MTKGKALRYWHVLVEAAPIEAPKAHPLAVRRTMCADTYAQGVEYLTRELKAEGLKVIRVIGSAPVMRRSS